MDDLAARGAEGVERHRWGYWDGLLRYLELDGALPETAGVPVAVDVAGSVELVVGGSACGLDCGLGTFADSEMHSAFAAAVVALVLVAVAVVDIALFPFAVGAKIEVVDHSDADWQLHCGS